VEKLKKLYSRTREEGYSSFDPHLWPERFDAPHNTPIPGHNTSGNRNVLVGSLGDIFGDWVEREHVETILNIVRDTPQWNYIFLTKNAKRYLEFDLPLNCWVGVKIDEQKEVKPAIEYFSRIKASVRFVSCDPMVIWLLFPTLEPFDWMIIGPKPKTKNKPAFHPPKIWISSLTKQARASGCKVFVKHLKDPACRGFPGDRRPNSGE
jgi:protein gp37